MVSVDLAPTVYSGSNCVQYVLRVCTRVTSPSYCFELAHDKSGLVNYVKGVERRELLHSIASLVNGDVDVYTERRRSYIKVIVRITSKYEKVMNVLFRRLRGTIQGGYHSVLGIVKLEFTN